MQKTVTGRRKSAFAQIQIRHLQMKIKGERQDKWI